MKWLMLIARGGAALIPALVVFFVSSVLSHSPLPPGGGGPWTIWLPALVVFLAIFFGVPVFAKIGNLNRKPAISSPREKCLLVLLVFLAVITLIVVVPILYAAHFERLNQ